MTNTNTATVHNPTNFNPAYYEVVDYIDNRRPEYFGQSPEAWAAEIELWMADIARLFGSFDAGIRKIHKCAHCGNGRVRWIAVVEHAPTGEIVAFGSECVNRLQFKDRAAFKLAQIQARAEARKVRFTIWNKREKFLAERPTFAAAIATIDNPIHARNAFVQNVVGKLNQWGELSDKQVDAVIESLKRDYEYAAKRAAEANEVKGDAPEGRQTVTGDVLSVKEYEGAYGVTFKALIKLENNARVFVTAPNGVVRGARVTLTATWTRKPEDRHFATGKRPILVKAEVPAAAQ